MGIDTRILFKVKDKKRPLLLWGMPSFGVEEIEDYGYMETDATHYVSDSWRYYGEGYARGPFGIIGGILMGLMSDDNVEKVWYGGDEVVLEMSIDSILEICRYYMENGNRPYGFG